MGAVLQRVLTEVGVRGEWGCFAARLSPEDQGLRHACAHHTDITHERPIRLRRRFARYCGFGRWPYPMGECGNSHVGTLASVGLTVSDLQKGEPCLAEAAGLDFQKTVWGRGFGVIFPDNQRPRR